VAAETSSVARGEADGGQVVAFDGVLEFLEGGAAVHGEGDAELSGLAVVEAGQKFVVEGGDGAGVLVEGGVRRAAFAPQDDLDVGAAAGVEHRLEAGTDDVGEEVERLQHIGLARAVGAH
jgi:hypothetical protein